MSKEENKQAKEAPTGVPAKISLKEYKKSIEHTIRRLEREAIRVTTAIEVYQNTLLELENIEEN